MYDYVTRIYDNKKFLLAFFGQYDGPLHMHGKYLKNLLVLPEIEKQLTDGDADEFARKVFIECKIERDRVFEVEADLQAEYVYEITLMGKEIYLAVFKYGELIYYGLPENLTGGEEYAKR